MQPAEFQQYAAQIAAASDADAWWGLDRNLRARPDAHTVEVQDLLRRIERASAPLIYKAMFRAMSGMNEDGGNALMAFQQRVVQESGQNVQFTFSQAMRDPDMSAFIRQVEAEVVHREAYQGTPEFQRLKAMIATAPDMAALDLVADPFDNPGLTETDIEHLGVLVADRQATFQAVEHQGIEDRVGTHRLAELVEGAQSPDEHAAADAQARLERIMDGGEDQDREQIVLRDQPGEHRPFADERHEGRPAGAYAPRDDHGGEDLLAMADELGAELGEPVTMKERLTRSVLNAQGLAAIDREFPGLNLAQALDRLIERAAEVAERQQRDRSGRGFGGR